MPEGKMGGGGGKKNKIKRKDVKKMKESLRHAGSTVKATRYDPSTGDKRVLEKKPGLTKEQWRKKEEKWRAAERNRSLMADLAQHKPSKLPERKLGSNPLQFCQWNARALDDLSMGWLRLLMDTTDVLAIQETWRDECKVKNLFKQNGFHVHTQRRRDVQMMGRRSGGQAAAW